MISEDEYLERIVAGIHAVTSGSANVSWNEIINGRQFDVAVRFTLGTLSYLVLVEVKNRTRRASASDVEAFVTKAKDQNASKAVFVTVAGYQHGALAVAQRHGVDLFTVSFDKNSPSLSQIATRLLLVNGRYFAAKPPQLDVSEPHFLLAVEGAILSYQDGKTFEMPTEQSQMHYYATNSLFEDGRSLLGLVEQHLQARKGAAPALGKTITDEIVLTQPMRVTPPDEYFFPSGILQKIDLSIAGREGRSISGNVFIEPTSLQNPVLYTNALTGEVTRYTLDQLPLGTSRIVPGRFYFQVHPLRYFHCALIEGDLITWDLIESFQGENLFRATYNQEVQYGRFYIPVADKGTQKRLERRLEDYRLLSSGS